MQPSRVTETGDEPAGHYVSGIQSNDQLLKKILMNRALYFSKYLPRLTIVADSAFKWDRGLI
jgi:hypothetical protein